MEKKGGVVGGVVWGGREEGRHREGGEEGREVGTTAREEGVIIYGRKGGEGEGRKRREEERSRGKEGGDGVEGRKERGSGRLCRRYACLVWVRKCGDAWVNFKIKNQSFFYSKGPKYHFLVAGFCTKEKRKRNLRAFRTRRELKCSL